MNIIDKEMKKIEDEFCKCFNIKPIHYFVYVSLERMIALEDSIPVYPNITSDHILELIAILSGLFNVQFQFEMGAWEVRYNTLKMCISAYNRDDLKPYIGTICRKII